VAVPLFNASTIPWITAVQQIAGAAGASADPEMTLRAHSSLRAAFQHFGTRYNWDFLRGEAVPVQVIGPFYQAGVSASAGQVSAASPTGHGIAVDDIVIGSGFMAGCRVTATAASGFGFNVAITGFTSGVTTVTSTFVRDFYSAPSDLKRVYTVRLLNSNKPLGYIGRRLYDRVVSDEFTAGTPAGYDLFGLGGRSKIRLLPPPASNDVLQVRYLRRFTIASASGSTTALDIPEDYESYVIAWAKWHFLTDKSEGRSEQGSTWMSLAQEGLKTMLSDQVSVPDEQLGFVPAHAVPDFGAGDRETRYIDWNS
jgi:hypothetical protein